MSSLLVTELATTCSALGYLDLKTNTYVADENVIETLKDLIRYLRRDDENHEVRVELGRIKVLQSDLVPLLKTYWEETEMFDVLLRLLVNLTTPTLVLFNEEVPTDKASHNIYLLIEEHLQNYKQMFTEDSIWAILSTKLSKILELDYAERGDENGLIIERILILVRNVLYVPSNPDLERRPDHDANLHDQVVWTLRQAGMLDIILYIASSPHEQVYYMHILEILLFMLREQSAEKLGCAVLERNHVEKLQDEAELLAIRHQEMKEKKQKVRKFTGARHSRFGGTYVVKDMKAIGDNELIYHKPLSALDKLNFDLEKRKTKIPKNRQPIKDAPVVRSSAFSVRLVLKDFCVEFLSGAYNTLMHHVKDVLARSKAQAHDESYYLWAMRFFMEFNRAHKFDLKLVSETLSIQTFHFVQQQMENYFDMIASDKKKLHLWSKRLHLALLAYRELLLTVAAMDKSTDETVVQAAKVLKSNIFYVIEYRELILTLLITYDETKVSQTYLKDLIETQHVFIRMLQKFCEKYGAVVVAEKSKKRKKKKQLKSTTVQQDTDYLDPLWDEVSGELSSILKEQIENTEVIPFDASSEVPIDEQKSEAMKNIQRKLRNKEPESAVALLRAAREVWPENDTFGSIGISFEEEYLILHEIFFADLGENSKQTEVIQEQNDADDEEEDEDSSSESYRESVIKFDDFAKRLAHPKIVRGCGLCLRNFVKNSPYTNLCIIKLLHRIAFDYKMYVMIFQASIFRTFQKIFELKDMPQYKELVRFAKYIMKQFFTVAAVNPKVYIEVLFWKSSKDAYDIENGYGTYQQKTASSIKAWTELEEEELQRLYEEHRNNSIEEDVIDWIVNNLINRNKTRKSVIKKLKELNLLDNYKPKSEGSKRNQPWTTVEENELKELYEEYKEADDPLGCIIENLSLTRPKNRIIEKMLVMGLIQDKEELKKKKRTKKRSKQIAPDNSPTRPSTSKQTTKPAKKKNNKRIQKFVKTSNTQLKQIILDLLNKDFHEPLQWISECVLEAAEDLKNADSAENEAIPILPLQESCEAAMERSEFQKLLKACGITEPTDEQEIYWRISGELSTDYIQECGNLIARALEGGLDMNEDNEQVSMEETIAVNEKSDGNEDSYESEANISDEEKQSEENPEPNKENVDPNRKINMTNAFGNNIVEQTQKRVQKSRIIINDESSEESGNEDRHVDVIIQEESNLPVTNGDKRDRVTSDSEEDKPKRKKTKILSSDEE